jgi:hypothetical protein
MEIESNENLEIASWANDLPILWSYIYKLLDVTVIDNCHKYK